MQNHAVAHLRLRSHQPAITIRKFRATLCTRRSPARQINLEAHRLKRTPASPVSTTDAEWLKRRIATTCSDGVVCPALESEIQVGRLCFRVIRQAPQCHAHRVGRIRRR